MRVAMVAVGAAAMVAAGFVVASQSGGDPYANCYEQQQPPDDLLASPEGQFGGQSFGFVPLGIGCDWVLADGSAFHQPADDLLPSVLGYGGLALAVIGGVGRGRR